MLQGLDKHLLLSGMAARKSLEVSQAASICLLAICLLVPPVVLQVKTHKNCF